MAQNINLHASGRKRRAPVSRVGMVALVLLAIATVGGLYTLEMSRQAQLRTIAQDTERAASRLEKQLTAAPTAAHHAQEELNEAEVEVASLEAVATRLSSGALGRTSGFTGQMRALARGTTDGLWLTGIRFDNIGAQIVLEGKSLDAARVPLLIERLRRAPQFAGTTFAAIELKQAQETGVSAPASLVYFRLATPVPESEKPGAKR